MITDNYKQLLSKMHQQGKFNNGQNRVKEIISFIEMTGPKTVIDYGCGNGSMIVELGKLFKDITFFGYDPSNSLYETLPPVICDCLTSLDVFEHFEPEHLETTLQEIDLTFSRHAYIKIALYPAKKFLRDGRNAHLILEKPAWWREKILGNMSVELIEEVETERYYTLIAKKLNAL